MMAGLLTPVVFVAAHCTHPQRPARVWEVALVRVQPQATGTPVEVARDAFRIEMNSTRDCDIEHLTERGFFARHPFGSWLAGGGDAHPQLTPGPSLATSLTAARRIARATYGCDVAAWDVTSQALALAAVLHGQHLAPTWSGRFLDLGSWTAAAVDPGAPWVKDMPAPRIGYDLPAPASGASALDLAVWDAGYWSNVVVEAS